MDGYNYINNKQINSKVYYLKEETNHGTRFDERNDD